MNNNLSIVITPNEVIKSYLSDGTQTQYNLPINNPNINTREFKPISLTNAGCSFLISNTAKLIDKSRILLKPRFKVSYTGKTAFNQVNVGGVVTNTMSPPEYFFGYENFGASNLGINKLISKFKFGSLEDNQRQSHMQNINNLMFDIKKCSKKYGMNLSEGYGMGSSHRDYKQSIGCGNIPYDVSQATNSINMTPSFFLNSSTSIIENNMFYNKNIKNLHTKISNVKFVSSNAGVNTVNGCMPTMIPSEVRTVIGIKENLIPSNVAGLVPYRTTGAETITQSLDIEFSEYLCSKYFKSSPYAKNSRVDIMQVTDPALIFSMDFDQDELVKLFKYSNPFVSGAISITLIDFTVFIESYDTIPMENGTNISNTDFYKCNFDDQQLFTFPTVQDTPNIVTMTKTINRVGRKTLPNYIMIYGDLFNRQNVQNSFVNFNRGECLFADITGLNFNLGGNLLNVLAQYTIKDLLNMTADLIDNEEVWELIANQEDYFISGDLNGTIARPSEPAVVAGVLTPATVKEYLLSYLNSCTPYFAKKTKRSFPFIILDLSKLKLGNTAEGAVILPMIDYGVPMNYTIDITMGINPDIIPAGIVYNNVVVNCFAVELYKTKLQIENNEVFEKTISFQYQDVANQILNIAQAKPIIVDETLTAGSWFSNLTKYIPYVKSGLQHFVNFARENKSNQHLDNVQKMGAVFGLGKKKSSVKYME